MLRDAPPRYLNQRRLAQQAIPLSTPGAGPSEPSNPTTPPPPQSRKRGRPRKSTTAPATGEPPAKKPRGRPRKVRPPSPEDEDDDDNETAGGGDESAYEGSGAE